MATKFYGIKDNWTDDDVANVIEVASEDGSVSSVKVNGVEYGGGGETESGIYIPETDETHPTINFTDTHTVAPTLYVIEDIGDYTELLPNDLVYVEYMDVSTLYGMATISSTSARNIYVMIVSARIGNNGSTGFGNTQCTHSPDETGDANQLYPRYWATESSIKPYSGTSSYLFRAGRSYKWYAFWL